MDLKQQFQKELQDAMRAQDEPRVNVIRMLIAALEKAQEERGKEAFDAIDSREGDIQPDRQQPLSRQEVLDIIRNEVQQRREAVEGFRGGGRPERAEGEETEIAILEEYMGKL